MNIQDRLNGFRGGVNLSRQEFTPDVQEQFIAGALGIRRPPEAALPDGHVAVPANQFNEMSELLRNYTTVFTQPGVKERIGEILGVTGPQPPPPAAPAVPAIPASPPPAAGPAAAATPPDQAPSAPATEPAPTNWWDGILGEPAAPAAAPANAAPVPPPAAPGQTVNPANPTAPPATMPATPPQPQPNAATAMPPDPGIRDYMNEVSAYAMSKGVKPDEVLGFFSGMNAQQAVDLYMAAKSGQNTSPKPSINIAEHNAPATPPRTSGGSVLWNGDIDRNAFRV